MTTRRAGTYVLLAIGSLAVILRAAYVLTVAPDPMRMVDSLEYDTMARDLLSGRGLTDQVGYIRPPLYPLFVAAMYALGGIRALQIAQLLIAGATTLAIGALAFFLSRSVAAAAGAALISAFYPWSYEWVGGLASENIFTFLWVVALLPLAAASRAPTWRLALGAGALLSVASLARANAIVLAPFLAAWLLWRDRGLARPILYAIASVAVLVPFGIYEVGQGHGFVLASSGGGLNFYGGNNPDVARFYDPSTSDAEWRSLNGESVIGPAAYANAGCPGARTTADCYAIARPADPQAFWYAAAFRYITAHPGEWALTELRKLLHYIRPWVDPRAYSAPVVAVSGISFTAIVLLAIPGIASLDRRDRALIVAILFGSILSAVIWMVQLRYRTALLDPVLIAAAGLGSIKLIHRLNWPSGDRLSSAGTAASTRSETTMALRGDR